MKLKNKRKLFVLLLFSIVIVGCTHTSSQSEASSSSKSSTSKSGVSRKRNSSAKDTLLPVGKIISTQKMNPDIAYKVGKKNATFYWTLKGFGTKGDISSDYANAKDEVFGITKQVVTTTGTYDHVVSYVSEGFERTDSPDGSKDYTEDADYGYVKDENLKRFSPVTAQWTYKKKKAYYLADICNHRIWNRPAYTTHYTYVKHVFDRLSTSQLYATKELVKHNGSHYVYLENAKGKGLGWVYKTSKVLIAGKYRDPGKQLLRPKKHEKMTQKVQSKKSTKNQVGVNDSLSMQQRVYLVRNKQHHLVRVLVMGMDNRPVKLTIHKGQVTKLSNYTYRRRPWKVVTNQKKLRTHYRAEHTYIDTDIAETTFYSKKSKKLAMVETIGYDGIAHAIIYRNGRVSFKTHVYRDVETYPLVNFK